MDKYRHNSDEWKAGYRAALIDASQRLYGSGAFNCGPYQGYEYPVDLVDAMETGMTHGNEEYVVQFILEDWDEVRECRVSANSQDQAMDAARHARPWDAEHATTIYAFPTHGNKER